MMFFTKSIRQMSIKTKVTLTVLATVAVLLFAISGSLFFYFHTLLFDTILTQQFKLVSEVAEQYNGRLKMARVQLYLAAASVNAGNINDKQALQHILDQKQDDIFIFDSGFLVIGADGRVRAESMGIPKLIGQDLNYRDYVREGLQTGKPLLSKPFRLTSPPYTPMIAMVQPIRDDDDHIIGLFVGYHTLGADNFLTSISTSGTEKGYLYLLQDRTIVMHPDPSRVMAVIAEGKNRGIDRAMHGFEGSLDNVNSRGVHLLSSFKRVGDTGWVLVANTPYEVAFSSLNRMAVVAGILTLIGMLLSIALVWYVTRRLTRPIEQLTSHLDQAFQDGAEWSPIKLTTGDELERLAGAFNSMMDEVRDGKNRLEQDKNFFSGIIQNSAAPMLVIDRNHTIIFWNNALAKLTGLDAMQMHGTTQQWKAFYKQERPLLADLIIDHSLDQITAFYGQSEASKFVEGAFRAESWLDNVGGKRRYLLFDAAPIFDSSGEIVAAVETLEDITERKRAELRIATQLAVSSILAESPSFADAILRVLEAVCTAIGWEIGGVWWLDKQENCLQLINCWYGPEFDAAAFVEASRTITFATGIGLPGKVWYSQQAVWIDDVLEEDNYLRKPFAAAAGLRGAFAIPVTLGGTIVGVMEFYTREVQKYDPFFLQMMVPLGSQLGQLVERKRAAAALRESERRFRETLENIRLMAVELDLEGNIVFCNDFLLDLTGWQRVELLGRNWFDTFLPAECERPDIYRESIAAGKMYRQYDQEIITRSGALRLVSWNSTILNSLNGEPSGISCIGEDITERSEADSKLRYMSTHDMLTGLYNRAFFEAEMERLALGRRFPVSIINADVDGLKGINDSQGHEMGDRLLRSAARIFLSAFRADDVVARVGGDEFIVLLPGTDAHEVGEVVNRVRKCQYDINCKEDRFRVSISLGVATANKAEELSKALKLSDERMYRDKIARKRMPILETGSVTS